MSYQNSYVASAPSTRTSGTISNVVIPTGGSVIVFALWDGSTGTPGVSASGIGGTWEEVTGVAANNESGNGYWQRVWINRTPTPGTYTIEVTHGNGYDVIKAFVQTEVPTAGALSTVLASAFQYQASPPAGTDGASSGNMTPPDTPWLLYGICADWTAVGAPPAGTGFTDLDLNGTYIGAPFTEAEYRTGTGTSAVAATFARTTAGPHYTTGILVLQVSGGDTTPDAFSFTDQTNAEIGNVYVSNSIEVLGIDAPAAISITGGEYRINGGSWLTAPSTVVVNDDVEVRGTSSMLYETAVNVTLTIGGVSDTFTITTRAFEEVSFDFILRTGGVGTFDILLFEEVGMTIEKVIPFIGFHAAFVNQGEVEISVTFSD